VEVEDAGGVDGEVVDVKLESEVWGRME